MRRKSTSHQRLSSTGWDWIMKNSHRGICKISLPSWKKGFNTFAKPKSKKKYINLKSFISESWIGRHKRYGYKSKAINTEHFYLEWLILKLAQWCVGLKTINFIWYLTRPGLVLFNLHYLKFSWTKKIFLFNISLSLVSCSRICTIIGKGRWDCHRFYSFVKRCISMLNQKEIVKNMSSKL